MDDEYEEVNDIMQSVMELSGIAIKLYKQNVETTIVNNIIPDYYAIFSKKEATQNELLFATNIFDEVLTHCT